MKNCRRLTITLLAWMLLFSPGAYAGLITAIGDVDAVNINQRPINVDLLDNILGVNTNVLVIGNWASDNRVTGIKSHWASLAGVNVNTIVSDNVSAASLIGVDFLFFMQNAFAINTSDIGTRLAINDYISNDGDFLFVSQNLGSASRSTSYNSFLADIGSSLGTTTNGCGGSSTIAVNSLTVGVSDFQIGGCNEVTGGTALVTNSTISVAFENVDQVPEPASIFLITLGLASLGFSRRK